MTDYPSTFTIKTRPDIDGDKNGPDAKQMPSAVAILTTKNKTTTTIIAMISS